MVLSQENIIQCFVFGKNETYILGCLTDRFISCYNYLACFWPQKTQFSLCILCLFLSIYLYQLISIYLSYLSMYSSTVISFYFNLNHIYLVSEVLHIADSFLGIFLNICFLLQLT